MKRGLLIILICLSIINLVSAVGEVYDVHQMIRIDKLGCSGEFIFMLDNEGTDVVAVLDDGKFINSEITPNGDKTKIILTESELMGWEFEYNKLAETITILKEQSCGSFAGWDEKEFSEGEIFILGNGKCETPILFTSPENTEFESIRLLNTISRKRIIISYPGGNIRGLRSYPLEGWELEYNPSTEKLKVINSKECGLQGDIVSVCEKSDGNLKYFDKYFQRGKITVELTEGPYQGQIKDAYDTCDGDYLTEYECDPLRGMMTIIYSCPSGCSGGACIGEAPPSPPEDSTEHCWDSESGKDHYEQGFVYLRPKNSPEKDWSYFIQDECIGSSHLSEKYCDEDQKFKEEIIGCIGLCIKGACVSSPTSSTSSYETPYGDYDFFEESSGVQIETASEEIKPQKGLKLFPYLIIIIIFLASFIFSLVFFKDHREGVIMIFVSILLITSVLLLGKNLIDKPYNVDDINGQKQSKEDSKEKQGINKKETKEPIQKASKVTEQGISELLRNAGAEDLHNVIFTSDTPKMGINIEGEEYMAEVIDNEVITKKQEISQEDIRINSNQEVILKSINSGDIEILKESISIGETNIEIINNKRTLFLKGYLELYNELVGEEFTGFVDE